MGRPSKKTPVVDSGDAAQAAVEEVQEVSKEEEKPKKKRGRPSKKTPVVDSGDAAQAAVEEVKERKPRKEKEEVNADIWGDLEERKFTRNDIPRRKVRQVLGMLSGREHHTCPLRKEWREGSHAAKDIRGCGGSFQVS